LRFNERFYERESRAHYWLFIIIPVAFIMRLWWVLNVHTAPVYDFLKYHLGAVSIVEGNGYKLYGNPTAFEPIGYPGFLALLYKIFGTRLIFPKLANIVLSLGIVILTYLLGKKLFNRATGVLAAAFIAFSPRNITYTSVLCTEIFFTFFLLLAIYLLLQFRDRKWSGQVIGILCGILALTKPANLLFPGVLFFLAWLEGKSFSQAFKKTIVIGLFMALTILPWTIRNYIVFNKFIPISTNGGITLYLNNNPYAKGAWQDPFSFPNSPLAPYKNEETGFWDELAVDKLGKELGTKWILENPGEFFKLGFKKLYYVFSDSWDVSFAVENLTSGGPMPNRGWVYKTAKWAYWGLLGALAFYLIMLVRGFLAGKKLGNHLVLWLPVLFFCATYFVFEGQPRYIFPMLPLFVIMAAWGLQSIKKTASY
jgi:4-amino-4-deoxy-L-arabinose transferase-like glycosyltransferase